MTIDDRIEEILSRKISVRIRTKEQADVLLKVVEWVEELFAMYPDAPERLLRKRDLFIARAYRAVSPLIDPL